MSMNTHIKQSAEDGEKDPEKKEKKGPPPSADEMLDTRKRTIPGDMLYPWAMNRAGVASAMGRASGTSYKDLPWNIKYPITTAIPAMMAGSLVGSAAGTAAGGPIGSMLGSALGTTAGIVGMGFFRRRQMAKIKEQYDAARAAGELDIPDSIDTSVLGRLGIFGAPHRIARQRAYNEMDAGEVKSETPRQIRNIAASIPLLSELTSVPIAIGEDIATARNVKKTKRDTGSGESDEPRNRKKASNPHPLLKYARVEPQTKTASKRAASILDLGEIGRWGGAGALALGGGTFVVNSLANILRDKENRKSFRELLAEAVEPTAIGAVLGSGAAAGKQLIPDLMGEPDMASVWKNRHRRRPRLVY